MQLHTHFQGFEFTKSIGIIGAISLVYTTCGAFSGITLDIQDMDATNNQIATASQVGHLSVSSDTVHTTPPLTIVHSDHPDVMVSIPAKTTMMTDNGEPLSLTNLQFTQLMDLAADLGSSSQEVVGSITFGLPSLGLYFSKPVGITVPVDTVDTTTSVQFKIRHEGDETFSSTGLTNDPSASCKNGIPSFTGTITKVVDNTATIYTCRASDFIALTTSKNNTSTQINTHYTPGKVFTGTHTSQHTSSQQHTHIQHTDTVTTGDTSIRTKHSLITTHNSASSSTNPSAHTGSLLTPYLLAHSQQSPYLCQEKDMYHRIIFSDIADAKKATAINRARLNCLVRGRHDGIGAYVRQFVPGDNITPIEVSIIAQRLTDGLGKDVSSDVNEIYQRVTPVSREWFTYIIVNRYDSQLPHYLSDETISDLIALDKEIIRQKMSYNEQMSLFTSLLEGYATYTGNNYVRALDVIHVLQKITGVDDNDITRQPSNPIQPTTPTPPTAQKPDNKQPTNTGNTNDELDEIYQAIAALLAEA